MALVDAGADLEAVSSPDAGGVPNATALLHAAVFGNTAVLDVLVSAGARMAAVYDWSRYAPTDALCWRATGSPCWARWRGSF